jgi:succinate dehydrogenase / fumarate reductase, cytochrome b subunit
MSRVLTFYRSSIGKKTIMALSGMVLFGFVLTHMIGNLKLYQGADAVNAYARFLREMGTPLFSHASLLWTARIILLASVIAHIVSAIQLAQSNRRARPVGYKKQQYLAASYAARTMIWSGPLLAAFIIYHIMHLTTGWVHPSFNPDDVYQNLVRGFQVWYISVFYIVAMLGLGYHMIHGVWSFLQSLGLNNKTYDTLIRRFALVATIAVVVGNISFPVSVLLGIVK